MSPHVKSIYICIAIISLVTVVSAQNWQDGHATFYGDDKGHETEKGACGYDVFEAGYGLATTALSVALYENGAKCGTCYEMKCVNDPQWCKPGLIQVTATNLCPSSTGPGAWCNAPLHHFDLTEPMFLRIAQYKAGIVPVQYRRIPCARQGGIKFKLGGNHWFLMVLVYNVGGVGDVTNMKIKGTSSPNWTQMSRNWGMNWNVNQILEGQALSFQVSTSDGKTIQFDNVVPSNWQFGQSFQGRNNF